MSEWEAVQRAIAWAEVTGGRLYVVHTSAGRSAELIGRARERGVNFTTVPQDGGEGPVAVMGLFDAGPEFWRSAAGVSVVAFAVLFLKEKFAWNYAAAFVCLAGAAYFAFAFKPAAA